MFTLNALMGNRSTYTRAASATDRSAYERSLVLRHSGTTGHEES